MSTIANPNWLAISAAFFAVSGIGILARAAIAGATDNASDLVDDLTLAMNKARQSAITQELSEISAGVEAMN